MNEKTLKDLLSSLKEAGKSKTSAYDTTATVTRIENGTAWVHIPGGVTETPVKLTINAKAGDNVQVRVSGGRAFMVGNATAPPTDDHTARQALAETRTVNKVVKTVREIAEKASKIAGNTNQYFWHTETGTDTGAHITEIPQEEFLADPENGGGNTLIRSNGVAVRDGLTELATFSADGSRIGQDSETHADVDYHSLELVDKEDNTYLHISDLRNALGEMTETFTGDGSTQTFLCMVRIASVSSVSINGVETSAYTFSGMGVIFTTAPANGAEIVVTYLPTETEKSRLKAYTLGIRGSGKVGAMSVAEGLNTVASGLVSHAEGNATNAQKDYSHAEGRSTTASYGAHAEGAHTNAYSDYGHAEGYYTEAGQYAHAEGDHTTASGKGSHAGGHGTKASSAYQTAIGQYNIEDTNGDYAFIVGNGTDDNNRSNAFAVGADGSVVAWGVKSFTPTWETGEEANLCHCVVSAGICSLFYQGPITTHATNTLLGTLPVGARPLTTVFCPFVKASVAYGTIRIETTGEIYVGFISSTTASNRIYFNCSYPVV